MIKVLVVDDSALVRKLLTEELNKQKDIQVVGTAMNPYIARDKIVKLRPDVITLDLEMPRMDGLSFLSKLMKHFPLPVVVVSSLTPKNSQNAINALQLGAVEVICKPGSAYSTQNITQDIVKAIRTASVAKFQKNILPTQPSNTKIEYTSNDSSLVHTTNKIIAIGSSTGGTRALEVVLSQLPGNLPGTVVVQHMPPVFTKSFAERLNSICQVTVKEAEDGDHIQPGTVLIAPGNYHMLVVKNGARYYTRIKQGPPVHHQRPSVDVLFNSVASSVGINAMGVILTGMGADGAKGLLNMKEKGSYTIGQDEATSVVYGMPREAYKIGAVTDQLPLDRIPEGIINHMKQKVLEPHL
jgi:two-component system chemotaxis response regulator CheB